MNYLVMIYFYDLESGQIKEERLLRFADREKVLNAARRSTRFEEFAGYNIYSLVDTDSVPFNRCG